MAWFILIVFIVMAWGVSHLQERSNRNWKAVAPGIIHVKQSYKGIVTYVFAGDQALGASCKQPPLWDIRKPLRQRVYTTEHPHTLRAWWTRVVQKHPDLRALSKSLIRVGYSPDIGLHVTVRLRGDLNALEENQIVALFRTMQETWYPQRQSVDPGYALREWIAKWYSSILMGSFVAIALVALHVMNTTYFGDTFYMSLGLASALLGSTFAAVYVRNTTRGSVYQRQTMVHLAGLAALSLIFVVPYVGLQWNEKWTEPVCSFQAPVLQWYSVAGKTRRFYAELDTSSCPSAPRERAEMRVHRDQYQVGHTLNATIYRGALGRYFMVQPQNH